MKDRLINALRDYFEWSRRETNAFLVLLPVTLLILFTPTLVKSVYPLLGIPPESDNRQLLDSLQAVIESRKPKRKPIHYYAFNPNEIQVEEMKGMGFPVYLATRIDKYRSKGGKFYIKTDLKKIYGFPEQLYKQLETYILLPETKTAERLVHKVIKKEVTLFAFNPNDIELSDWQKLGLDTRLAKRIINYREKGGSFKVKSDLKKIYGIPKNFYSSVEAYILLPDTLITAKTMIEIPYQFDINQATSEDLKKVKGIGEVLANRIVKFRYTLGGSFYEKEQLKEVWGLGEEALNNLMACTTLSKEYIQKIRINYIDIKKLSNHPYVTYQQARLLVNYRIQHGFYKSWEDIPNSKGIEKGELERLKAYLSYD